MFAGISCVISAEPAGISQIMRNTHNPAPKFRHCPATLHRMLSVTVSFARAFIFIAK